MMWKRFRSNRHPLLDGDHVCVLSKMIVWLTMEQEIPDGVDDGHGKLVKLLFGGLEAEFEHFWDEHWERSPFLMEEDVMGREVRAGLLKAWRAESDSFALEELLTRTLACPPFNSDELDASQIYKEVEKNLGKPLVFGQDIRLVKSVCTAGCTKQCSTHTVQEEDYHRIGLGANRNKDVCMYADVHTCIGAYESGYTIALRGLEFRCSQIAAIAEALAVCFGQATVGANLYMTPSYAQGFKPHHDDHCVLVWQLTGCKAWKLWAPKGVLPRLYSQETKLENVFADEEDAFRVFLKEGSALYIPRGFPHAANTKMQSEARVIERPVKSCHECTQTCTKIPVGNCNGHTERYLQSYNVADAERTGCLNMNEDGLGLPALELLGSCSCMKKWEDSQWTSQKDTVQSLHITFGVEVEPPFDWEGLIHMSLCCWAEDQNWEDIFGGRELGACQTSTNKLSDLYKGLLHVAIRQCGDKCSAFRKACLVAAKPSRKGTHNTNESFFKVLLQDVAQTADFKEALNFVLTAIDSSESTSLDWMHWLRHLSSKHKPKEWVDPVVFFHDRLTGDRSLAEGLENMEVKFTKAKNSFVSCASFAEACDVFISLLCRYRSVRKRFTSGMLVLQI
eukprot:c43387_g1_i1 orf=1040-2899(+)